MTTVNEPPQSELFEPGGAAPLATYARRLWDMRHYARAEAHGRLEAGHAENVLGRLWLFLEPTLFIGVYYVLFGILLKANRGVDADFLAFLTVGKVVYGFMRRAVVGAAGSLSSDEALSAPTSMPQATYPVTAMLKSEIAFRYELVVMIAFVFLRGVTPSLSWLLTIPLGVVAFAISFGAGLILVRLISNFADLRSALPQLMTLGMYASGVIFPIEQYAFGRDHETLILKLLALNPFYALVKLNQWVVVGYRAPEMDWIIGSAAVWALVLPVLGLWWFMRAERRYSSAIFSG